jgi:hypothetical protein
MISHLFVTIVEATHDVSLAWLDQYGIRDLGGQEPIERSSMR